MCAAVAGGLRRRGDGERLVPGKNKSLTTMTSPFKGLRPIGLHRPHAQPDVTPAHFRARACTCACHATSYHTRVSHPAPARTYAGIISNLDVALCSGNPNGSTTGSASSDTSGSESQNKLYVDWFCNPSVS